MPGREGEALLSFFRALLRGLALFRENAIILKVTSSHVSNLDSACNVLMLHMKRGTAMSENIRITLLGSFHIYRGAESMDASVTKSRKGMTLLQYLALQHGENVPIYRLIDTLWAGESSSNPESALKTLVSRLRVILSQVSPALAECIVTERGSYRWVLRPGVSVDLYEFEDLEKKLTDCNELTEETQKDYQRVISLYAGNLLQGNEEDWVQSRSVTLHSGYLKLIYQYLNLLKAAERYNEIIDVCRAALDVDAFDETLHLQLMNALVKTCRNNEALMQYKHVTNLHFRYLGVQPPEGIQEFYKQIIQAGNTLEMSIDAIREELQEYGEASGAFVCEYAVFKEIYNLQMRNLERLGSTMFIALLMVSGTDSCPISPLKLNNVMKGLLKVLTSNLRKGDTITQFSPTQYALLLPTVNYDTGKAVMERLKRKFYQAYPNSNYMLTYRLGPLSSGHMVGTKAEKKNGDAGEKK